VPYAVAVALIKGDVSIECFTQEAIRDSIVLGLAGKVYPTVAPEFEKTSKREIAPAIVEIIQKNGKAYSKKVNFSKGNPLNPMSMQELKDKFKKCLKWSRKSLTENKINEIISNIEQLERNKDVGCMLPYLNQKG